MADLLETGMGWLAGQLKANASRPVTYKRGADSVVVQATLGSQLLKTSDRLGNTKVERTDRDFLILAADLVLNGNQTTPASGDVIEVTFGAVTQKFEVMAIGSEAPWRYSDPHQLMLRIHTKYVGVA
jgi:hypothetical protein